MTSRTSGSYASSVAYYIKRPGKEQPILGGQPWPVVGYHGYDVRLTTDWGEIKLPKKLVDRPISLTPKKAAEVLNALNRRTLDSVRVPVKVTQHGDGVVSADVRVIRALTSEAYEEKIETLFFLGRYLDSLDGESSVPYWALRRAFKAQFARGKHNLDPACPLLPDPGSVLRPRGKWGGTVYLARLVLEHFSAEEMGESNYESVRSLLQDEEDSSL